MYLSQNKVYFKEISERRISLRNMSTFQKKKRYKQSIFYLADVCNFFFIFRHVSLEDNAVIISVCANKLVKAMNLSLLKQAICNQLDRVGYIVPYFNLIQN